MGEERNMTEETLKEEEEREGKREKWRENGRVGGQGKKYMCVEGTMQVRGGEGREGVNM